MTDYINIDGSLGEGGGQILRSSIALSMITGKALHVFNIRAKRSKPGLLRQHLTAVKAAIAISQAEATGVQLGATEFWFEPKSIQGGDYFFAIGSAGSASLVMQTILYPLMFASVASAVRVEGGTYNDFAPTYDFLQEVLLPYLQRMGAKITLVLDRYGFYPQGGGHMTLTVEPSVLKPIKFTEFNGWHDVIAESIACRMPKETVGQQVKALQRIPEVTEGKETRLPSKCGTGNVLYLRLKGGDYSELLVGFGGARVATATVIKAVKRQANKLLGAKVGVGEYLADQLLLPMALAGSGSFETMQPTQHSLTNAAVIGQLLGIGIQFKSSENGLCKVIIDSG